MESSFTLLYDGHCPFCCRAVKVLERLGLTRQVTPRPWQDGEQDVAEAYPELTERIRVEVLLVDTRSGQVQGGLDAFIRLCSMTRGWSWLAALLAVPSVHAAGQWLYRLVSLNRRILFPPPAGTIGCSCDPPDDPQARRQLYRVLSALALAGTALFVILVWKLLD